AGGVHRVPPAGLGLLRRQLHRALAELAALVVCRELLVVGLRASIAPEEVHVRQHDHRLDLAVLRERHLQQAPRAVDRRRVFVVAGDQRVRRLHGRLRDGGGGDGDDHGGDGDEARGHRPNSSTLTAAASVHDPRRVIAIGVQTWGTDVAALRRYWAAADALGYARVTYGDGLWGWTHDGWTLLAALALETRRCRIGPAVTYAFDAAAHHPSWLAKRAVAIDHLSQGRLDLRFAVGAEAPDVAASWERHGIAYPPAGERLGRAGRARGAVRRSVEVDAALAESAEEAAAAVERFCERRNIARDHPLLDGALVGNADAVLARARAYGEAGATDLMVGFADFPA